MLKHSGIFLPVSETQNLLTFKVWYRPPVSHDPTTEVLGCHNPDIDRPSCQKVTNSKVVCRAMQGWESGAQHTKGEP